MKAVGKKIRGFTLIELLVVVTIISILAAVLMANFNDAREVTRNKAFAAEMKEVQLAIELYKAQNDHYPAAASGLVPEYIRELPQASKSANSSCVLNYVTDAGGTYYKYTAANCHAGATSQADGIKQDDELARCPSSCPSSGNCVPTSPNFYQSFAIYSVGPAVCQ